VIATVEIPLHRNGKPLGVMTLIEAGDYDFVMERRWCLGPNGYVFNQTQADGRVYLHRLLLGLPAGDARQGDHRNRNRLDNRRENLRIVTQKQQMQNLPGWGRSAHRGICWHGHSQRWMAYGEVDGKRVYLGYFDTEKEAAAAARTWRQAHMPFAID
jgi:hypothetical protein